MSQFASKARQVAEKAAQLKAAMEKAPATVAQIRETVAATTSQLQQLRAEVQANIAGLRAVNGDSISTALQEIIADRPIYLQAGYNVSALDLEVSPVERLLVHLQKLDDTHPSQLRTLIAANQTHPITHAILSALLQAHGVARNLELPGMEQSTVLISIGPTPAVRLCWCARETAAPPLLATATAPVTAAPASAFAAPPVIPSLASYSSSFFERPTTQTTLPVNSLDVTPRAVPVEQHATTEPVPSHSSLDLLTKYKLTPHFSKYRRGPG